jgi:hypothetical protein
MFIGEMRQMMAEIFKVMRTLCCRVITIFWLGTSSYYKI